jgi:outer membrane protein assembly factor BamB
MKKFKTNIASLLLLVLIVSKSAFSQNSINEYWAQWRGPLMNGTAIVGNPPTVFGESKNLKWKTAIPGKGHATPIVWGDNIILLTAVPTSEAIEPTNTQPASPGGRAMSGTKTNLVHDFKVVLVDRKTGNFLWEKTVARELPIESTHDLGSWASNSPCTDGENIYAFFGSRGIFCLDFKGNILWQKDYGQMEIVMNFGEGTSPALYKDKLFIQWDHQGESFIVALDKKTGNEIWKKKRDEITSWATPMVIDVNGKTQVITSATNQVRSYDAETGDIIWYGTGMTRNVIPNPVYADGILYLMSGFRGSALQAIELAKANGNINDSITNGKTILWKYNQDTPYTPSPVLMNGKLYFIKVNNGFLTCLDAKTGDVNYSNQKLEGISTMFSSPTGGAGKLYIAAKNVCLVIKAGSTFELLASNPLDDNFHSSPVIVGNELILRGFNSLYCFSEK